MERIIILLIGVLLGMWIYSYAYRAASIGTLYIDEDAGMYLELKEGIDKIANKKTALVNINHLKHNSHE